MSEGVWRKAEAAEEAAPRRGRWVARVVLTSFVLVLVAAGWVAARAMMAAGELAALEQEFVPRGADDALDGVSAELLEGALPRLPQIADRAARARSLVGDPVWMIAEQAPIAGGPLRTLRVLAEQSDALIGGAAVPLLEAVSAEQDAFLTVDAVDMGAVRRLAAAVDEAGERVAVSRAALERLEEDPSEPAHDRVERLRGIVRAADDTLRPLRILAAAAPALLGAEDARNYLVLFLTPAELRSGGGLPGAAAMLGFEDGVPLRGAVYSTRDYSPAPEAPVVPLTPTELALYGNRPARLLQDTTATDDFTRTGEFARALTEYHHGVDPTGILAIDVAAVGYLLEATGPVALEGPDTISAENSADLLMNKVYLRYSQPADQDAYFAMITERVLAAATTRGPDPSRLGAAVVRGVREGRIQAWSSEDGVQSALAELGVAERSTPLEGAVLGVYLNDRTSAKMDYYLAADAEIVWTACADGRRFDQVSVTLDNGIAAEDVEALPWYITGDGSVVPKGHIATQIVMTGPIGSTIAGDPRAEIVTRDDANRPRVAWTAVAGPGEQTTRTVVFESDEAAGAPKVDSTPAMAVFVEESRGALARNCGGGG